MAWRTAARWISGSTTAAICRAYDGREWAPWWLLPPRPVREFASRATLPCEGDGGAKCKGFIALKRLDVPSEIWWEMIFPLRFGEARVDGSAHRLLRRELLPKLELFGLIELARRGKSRRLLVRTTPLFSEALSFCI